MLKVFKNKIFQVLLVFLLILGSVGIYKLNSNADQSPIANQNLASQDNTSESQSSLEQVDTNNLTFTLLKEAGNVLYKKTATEEYQTLLEDQLDLPSNSFVKTEIDSQAHTILPDNSLVSIDQSSELQIILTDKKTDILQNTGNTWHRIQKLGVGSNYEVKTSNTLATVRGTIFGIKNSTIDSTEVYVLDSQVQVQQYEDVKTEKLSSSSELLVAGKHALVNNFNEKDGIQVNDIMEEKKNTIWFRKNRILDEEFQKDVKPDEIIRKLKEDKTLIERIQKLNEVQENISIQNPPLDTIKVTAPVSNNQNTSTTSLGSIDALKILGLNSTDCQEFDATNAEINLKQAVDTKQVTGKNIDSMIAYLDQIKQTCGTDSGDAYEVIPKFIPDSKAPRSTTSVATQTTTTSPTPKAATDPKFQLEVNAKLEYYTVYSTDVRSFCNRYAQSSTDAILNEFNEIEKKYNTSAGLAQKYRPLIGTIMTSCKDFEITSKENSDIEAQKAVVLT